MAAWSPIPGNHWMFDDVSDNPGRMRPGLHGREQDARSEMLSGARAWIASGWRVERSGRDRILLIFDRNGERRTLTVLQCPGPPVCTSCERVRQAAEAVRPSRVILRGADGYACDDCGLRFSDPSWHCHGCGRHWHPSIVACKDAHCVATGR